MVWGGKAMLRRITRAANSESPVTFLMRRGLGVRELNGLWEVDSLRCLMFSAWRVKGWFGVASSLLERVFMVGFANRWNGFFFFLVSEANQ